MERSTLEAWTVRPDDFTHAVRSGSEGDFLLRYVVLAPSSHNSQPWCFAVTDDAIDVFVDATRWLRVADPDKRELFISVGCAIENLLIVAERFGYTPRVTYVSDPLDEELVARVALGRRGTPATPHSEVARLFEAIAWRRTDRSVYDARPVPAALRDRLTAPAVEGVGVHLTDDAEITARVADLTRRADRVQFADAEWRNELAEWLARGAFGTGWLVSKASGLAVRRLDMGSATAKKDHQLIESAPMLGLVTVEERGRDALLQAGRAFERLFLTASAHGLALQPMNQVLQVRELREELERILPDAWGAPVLVFRLGYGRPGRHTPRRPLSEVVRWEGRRAGAA